MRSAVVGLLLAIVMSGMAGAMPLKDSATLDAAPRPEVCTMPHRVGPLCAHWSESSLALAPGHVGEPMIRSSADGSVLFAALTVTEVTTYTSTTIMMAVSTETGEATWSGTLDVGGGRSTTLHDIEVAPDGSAFLLAGSAQTTGPYGEPFVAALGPQDGQMRWLAYSNDLSDGDWGAYEDITVSDDSTTLYVTGALRADGTWTQPVDAYATSNGTSLWSSSLARPPATTGLIGRAVHLDAGRGRLVAVGETSSDTPDILLTALDAASGQQVWQVIHATPYLDFVHTSTTDSAATLYTMGGSWALGPNGLDAKTRVSAFSLQDGEVQWSVRGPGDPDVLEAPGSLALGRSSPTLFVGTLQTSWLFFPVRETRALVRAFDSGSGGILWETETRLASTGSSERLPALQHSPATQAVNALLWKDTDGGQCHLQALNATTGERQALTLLEVHSGPVLCQGLLPDPSSEERLYYAAARSLPTGVHLLGAVALSNEV